MFTKSLVNQMKENFVVFFRQVYFLTTRIRYIYFVFLRAKEINKFRSSITKKKRSITIVLKSYERKKRKCQCYI
jgi:hypothetical protein